MTQFGFIYDPVKCMGCHSCAVACKAESNTPDGVRYRRVVYKESGTFAAGDVSRTFTSMGCFHCANPACVEACPSGAAQKDANTGLVQIDADGCIGCKRCLAACPYGAPQFNRDARKTEKCTGCEHRVFDSSGATPVRRAGVRPACVVACPSGALAFDVKPTWGSGTKPTGFYDGVSGSRRTRPSIDFE